METLTLTHWLLSFAGALLVILGKVYQMQQEPGYTFGAYVKKYWISLLMTAITIPVLLVTITDTSLSGILPINNVTAFLCGYQTQEILKTLTSIAAARYTKRNEP